MIRLGEEAQTVLADGLETTAWALSTGCFHIINNPNIFQKLRAELKEALPDPNGPLDWLQLEKLPYLSACIQEAIRLSYGVTSRGPRISPNKPTKYKDWEIPAGTPVSITIVDVHHDERIFPNSRAYIPERWLNNLKAYNGAKLSRYFVSFSRGSRSCLGIKLVLEHSHQQKNHTDLGIVWHTPSLTWLWPLSFAVSRSSCMRLVSPILNLLMISSYPRQRLIRRALG